MGKTIDSTCERALIHVRSAAREAEDSLQIGLDRIGIRVSSAPLRDIAKIKSAIEGYAGEAAGAVRNKLLIISESYDSERLGSTIDVMSDKKVRSLISKRNGSPGVWEFAFWTCSVAASVRNPVIMRSLLESMKKYDTQDAADVLHHASSITLALYNGDHIKGNQACADSGMENMARLIGKHAGRDAVRVVALMAQEAPKMTGKEIANMMNRLNGKEADTILSDNDIALNRFLRDKD